MPHDHPSPWSSAGHQQGWPPAPPVAYAPEPPPGPPQLPHYVAPRPIEVRLLGQPAQGRGLAVAGVVLGGLALGIWLLVALTVLPFFFLDDEGGGGGYATPRGTLAPATSGGLSGEALAAEVTRSVGVTGGVAEDVVCPDTAKVAQDVTTVCLGTDYGEEATFLVFFEDAKGAYTLLEI